MRLTETFRSMKDIAIGVADGDVEAIALADKLSHEQKLKHSVIFDSNHRLYYAFESYGLSEKKTASASFYKYTQYCRENKYPMMRSVEFQSKLKLVGKSEYDQLKSSKGSRFKEIN